MGTNLLPILGFHLPPQSAYDLTVRKRLSPELISPPLFLADREPLARPPR